MGRSRKSLAAVLAVSLVVALGATFLIGTSIAGAGTGTAAPATVTVSPDTGLTNGQTVTVSGTYGVPGAVLNVTAHLCIHGGTYGNDTDFALSNLYCTPTKVSPQADTQTSQFPGATATSFSFPFHVGIGTATWNDIDFGGSSHTITCVGTTVTCDIVVEVASSSTTTFYVQPLGFASTTTPGAPTSVAATLHDNGTSHVTWVAATTGNGIIDHYVITATRKAVGGGAADASSPRTLTVGNVLAGDILLNNFTNYDITVHAHVSNAVDTGSQTGPESSPAQTASPLPGAPGAPTGTSHAGSVDLLWTAPTYTTNLTGYEVTATGGVTPLLACMTPPSPTTSPVSYTFNGLANGTSYTFTVRASYNGTCVITSNAQTGTADFGPASAGSAGVTPSNVEVDQLVIVDRPQGALVLTQACDATIVALGAPYPVDSNGVPLPSGSLYPTSQAVSGGPAGGAYPGILGSCSVDMHHASFVSAAGVPSQTTPASIANHFSGNAGYPTVGEGQWFKADGAINQVSVVDTRDNDQGWKVNAMLKTDFQSGSQRFSARQLGIQPAVTDHTPAYAAAGDPTYTNDAQSDPDVLPASHAGDTGLVGGLGESQQIAHATALHGLGIAHIDALLHVLIPVYAQHGVYSAILQITAI
jgi:hypothetical protein